MASYSLYEKYKKDTQLFLFWLANESKWLFLSNRNNPSPTPQTPQIDINGPLNVNGLVPRARYLVSLHQQVPHFVFSALNSAIAKRNTATASYRVHQGATVDPAQAASNASHQHFTDILQQCFDILGGAGWTNSTQDTNDPSIRDLEDELSSRFKALNVQNNDASSEEEEEAISSRPRQQRKPGKGKGKKKGKSKKAKGKQPAKEPVVHEEISMESLRNLDGQDAMAANYLIAVHSAAQQWIELRWFIQCLWREVAYDELNSAVAAATSKVAVSMVQRTNAAMLADFPGNGSYPTIVRALARGDVEHAHGTFIINLDSETGTRTIQDIQEQFLYNTYKALKDFLVDFRHTRSGRPSRNMKKRFGNWDPVAILMNLSHDERLAWRRIYIIKWLYDLVNVSSAAQLKSNRALTRPRNLEDVNWAGGDRRTIFGLNEFAADITRMAMQDSKFRVDDLIQPHHVFQLQCIVDSFTVSRGWMIPMDDNHNIGGPANFQVTREIDLFLDREKIFVSGGFPLSAQSMAGTLQDTCEDFPIHRTLLIDILRSEEAFVNCLGEHVYAGGEVYARAKPQFRDLWDGIEPSQFGAADANGLHKYSPYLCGAGLEEALSISYKQMMWLWQQMREPLFIMHIYKFLKQRQYFDEPIPFWEALTVLFKKGVFRTHANERTSGSEALQTLLESQQTIGPHGGQNIHEFFNVARCHNFNRESALSAYRKADWNFEQVGFPDVSSEEDLSILQSLGSEWLPVSEPGDDEQDLGQETTPSGPAEGTEGAGAEAAEQMPTTETTTQGAVDDPTTPRPGLALDRPRSNPMPNVEYRNRDIINWSFLDFLDDVHGFSEPVPLRPLSGLNYPLITRQILDTFNQIEDSLRQARNPLYTRYRDSTAQDYHRGARGGNLNERGSMFLTALRLYRTPEEEAKGQVMDPAAKQFLRFTADALAFENRKIFQFTYWADITRHALRAAQNDDDQDG
ncbi:hypothetical protein FLAG1_09450 [Fusarium langsethiae]|uniref:DUF6604 domain-containing protein n=1 Tax=Fusarium langsethiae TaxID=179993 RepID=A0A0M9EQT4_FUSLA|nr:hypothetical protein FLAG1_09450 [Fusarium langsethiae]GKU21063.1 unnamed protein product [Fusarium langsethiae]